MSNEIKISDISKNLDPYINNPAAIQGEILDIFKNANNGDEYFATTQNPTWAVLATSVGLASAAVNAISAETRSAQSANAQTQKDLYRHMSGPDYLDRFSKPSRATLALRFGYDELLEKLVTVPNTQTRKLTIPRNTVFNIGTNIFCINYPIDIIQYSHGEITVRWDTSVKSPIVNLETNLLRHRFINDSNLTYLSIEVPVLQLDVKSTKNTVKPGVSSITQVSFDDQYYFCRVYSIDKNGVSTELQTTHSNLNYDLATPTAVLEVYDGLLQVSIPNIYTLSQVSNIIYIEVYTTKGELNLDLSSFSSAAFKITWRALLPQQTDNSYSNPLKNFTNYYCTSTAITHSGANGRSFEELRQDVINYTMGGQNYPISNVQIQNENEVMGYTLVKDIDHVTNRSYLSTKRLPVPNNPKLITPANASIEEIPIIIRKLLGDGNVYANGERITISPDMVWRLQNGRFNHVPSLEIDRLKNLSPEQRASSINQGNYYYSPYHYVLDETGTNFDLRPYYLDEPNVISKSFNNHNESTGLYATINGYYIEHFKDRYEVVVLVTGNAAWDDLKEEEIGLQMSFQPQGSTTRCYLNGVYLGKNSEGAIGFQFNISSQFDIDSEHGLFLKGFKYFANDMVDKKVALTHDFQFVIHTSKEFTSWKKHDMDSRLAGYLLVGRHYALTEETLTIKFGDYLERLWANSRTLITEADYQRYDADVFARYTSDVFVNSAGEPEVEVVNGDLIVNVIHKKGDLIYKTMTLKDFVKYNNINPNELPQIYVSPKTLNGTNIYLSTEKTETNWVKKTPIEVFDMYLNQFEYKEPSTSEVILLDTLNSQITSIISHLGGTLPDVEDKTAFYKQLVLDNLNLLTFSSTGTTSLTPWVNSEIAELQALGKEMIRLKINIKRTFAYDEHNTYKVHAPIYLHRGNEIVRDYLGKPVLKNDRELERLCSMLLIEGSYYFAIDGAVDEYRLETARTFNNWCLNEIGSLQTRLLEQTKIYYYPQSTIGNIDVIIGDNQLITIPSEQSFKVSCFVKEEVLKNQPLLDTLRAETVKIINNRIGMKQVSMSALIEALVTSYASDVIDVRVTGLGGELNLQALTVTDEARRLALGKRLSVQADNKIIVEEDVYVEFVKHQLN